VVHHNQHSYSLSLTISYLDLSAAQEIFPAVVLTSTKASQVPPRSYGFQFKLPGDLSSARSHYFEREKKHENEWNWMDYWVCFGGRNVSRGVRDRLGRTGGAAATG
jgi:hypothetical protein